MKNVKKVKVSVTQSCPILCDPMDAMDCSLPGSSVHGILQARILQWVAIPSPKDLPNPGIQPGFPALQVDSLLFEPPRNTFWGKRIIFKIPTYKVSIKEIMRKENSRSISFLNGNEKTEARNIINSKNNTLPYLTYLNIFSDVPYLVQWEKKSLKDGINELLFP